MNRPEKTAAQLRRAARGNVPGVLGMEELAMLAPPKTPGLPSAWHEVRDERTGHLLYWRREHSGYEVWPHAHQFSPCLEMQPIAPLQPTLTHAILACRDHMHAQDCVNSQPGRNTSHAGTTSDGPPHKHKGSNL